MEEVAASALLTVGGVTVATNLILQLLVKPWLKRLVQPDENRPSPRYPAIMNTAAFAVAIILALLGQALVGLTYESVLTGFLVALVSAAASSGLHEFVENAAGLVST